MQAEPTKRTRLSQEERKSSIIDGATKLSEDQGYKNFSSLELATELGLQGHSLLFHHFRSMDAIRDEVMRKAIQDENLKIIGQGIAGEDPIANAAPERLRRKALSALKN